MEKQGTSTPKIDWNYQYFFRINSPISGVFPCCISNEQSMSLPWFLELLVDATSAWSMMDSSFVWQNDSVTISITRRISFATPVTSVACAARSSQGVSQNSTTEFGRSNWQVLSTGNCCTDQVPGLSTGSVKQKNVGWLNLHSCWLYSPCLSHFVPLIVCMDWL